MLTPERERELAARVAQDIVSESGAEYLPYIDWHAVSMRLPDVPELEGLSRHDQVDPCRRIAELARTATVTVTIPSSTEES